jgi:hypothetical protein
MPTDDEWGEAREGHPPFGDGPAGDDLRSVAGKLAELGVNDTAVNIRNKVAGAASPPCSCSSASGDGRHPAQPGAVSATRGVGGKGRPAAACRRGGPAGGEAGQGGTTGTALAAPPLGGGPVGTAFVVTWLAIIAGLNADMPGLTEDLGVRRRPAHHRGRARGRAAVVGCRGCRARGRQRALARGGNDLVFGCVQAAGGA